MANEEIEVYDSYLTVRFGSTVKVSTLVNPNFLVFTTVATPVQVTNPFEVIDLQKDYNSISRTLILRYANLSSNTDYVLKLENLKTAAGRVIPTESIAFHTLDNIPSPPPDIEPTRIIDHSVKSTVFVDHTITANNPAFYVQETDPSPEDAVVDNDYNNGRVIIRLSTPPSGDVTSYIRAQRKLLSRTASRWEPITPHVSVSGSNVFVDFPSEDATPVYNTAGHTYYSDGYKYRVRISRDIGNATGQLISEDRFIVFLVGVDPLDVDPEEFQILWPQVPLSEITELVYRFSLDAIELSGSTAVTPLVRDFVYASVACALTRTYDIASGASVESITLGDLTINTQNTVKANVTRSNATTWCELAGVIRVELINISTGAGMKAIVRGSRFVNPIPVRQIQHAEWRDWN